MKRTKYPGVTQTRKNEYAVRAEYQCPKTGRTRTLRRRVEAATPLEAAKIRDDLVREARNANKKPQRLKLKDFAKSWLATKLESIAASTADRYLNELTNHILPAFGDYWVDAITRDDLTAWRDRQPGKPASVNSVLRTMKLVVRDATRELKLSDPTEGVASVRDASDEIQDDADGRILTLDELQALLTAAERVVPQWYPLIRVLAVTGLRFSEATALKWQDIDFERGVVSIARKQVRKELGKPKTRKSRRVLPVEAVTLELLARVKADAKGKPDNWIFPSDNGELRFNGVLTKPLRKAAEAAGLSVSPSPHWFRRSLNRLLALQSSERVQMAMLGHVTDRMRLHYDHVLVDEKRTAVARVFASDPDTIPDTASEKGTAETVPDSETL